MRDAACVSLLAGILAACSGESSLEPVAAPPVSQAASTAAPPPVRDERRDGELAQARRQVAQLQAQVREQQDQIERAYAEAERFQRGLDKCVGELNRVADEAAAAASYAPATAPRAARGRVHTLGAPRVQIAGDSAIVTVKVWNAGDGAAAGNVDLELVLDGEVIDSSSEWVELSPRTDQVVTATFWISSREGTYSARARLGF